MKTSEGHGRTSLADKKIFIMFLITERAETYTYFIFIPVLLHKISKQMYSFHSGNAKFLT